MNKFIKSAVVLALSLSLVFAFTACGGSSSDSESSDTTYVAAMEPTFPPFDTTDDDGELSGFDVDMVNAIAKDQGFKVKWKNMEFDGLIPALDSGNADIIASGLSVTKERKKKVDFSDTYYDSGLALAVAKDNKDIKSLDDLTSDSVVGVQIGTSGAKKADALKKDGKIKEVKTYNGLDVTFQDLQNGTVDAVINDLPVTKSYIEKQPDTIKIVGDTIDAESYGIAVKKGNTELVDKLNAGLKNIKDDGTYDKLYKEWKLGE
ncbi:MAG: basic amino acid ABC transporter substrate-binding protein [Eubacteriaceae bacterium]|nr:basic amino acid ABC transporter substrate-binding protein [Eubacteriaceae bacterium]